jgi:hypothetical protein
LINQYERDINKKVRIKILENVIATVFHWHYEESLFNRIQDYDDVFTELTMLGQKMWIDGENKKLRLVQNAQILVWLI